MGIADHEATSAPSQRLVLAGIAGDSWRDVLELREIIEQEVDGFVANSRISRAIRAVVLPVQARPPNESPPRGLRSNRGPPPAVPVEDDILGSGLRPLGNGTALRAGRGRSRLRRQRCPAVDPAVPNVFVPPLVLHS